MTSEKTYIIFTILKDERYTGKCIYGKTKVAKIGSQKLIKQPESEWFVVPNRFPVIIPQELFDEVDEIRRSRERPYTKRGVPSPRIFLGNIRCGHCGYAMNFHETQYSYYMCHARQADDDLKCQGNRIMESELAEAVLVSLKRFAQICIDEEKRLEVRRSVMRSDREEIKSQIAEQERIASKLLVKGNELFEQLLEGQITDEKYKALISENKKKVSECQRCVEEFRERLLQMPPIPDPVVEKSLVGKMLSIEKLDRKLADLTVKCIDIFKDGTMRIEWNFSKMFDSMFPDDLLETLPEYDTFSLNRTWVYFCTLDGWERMTKMREQLYSYAKEQDWLVVGDSFDNGKPRLEAMGFRQMREAVRQGRVDNVLVYDLKGLAKSGDKYERFKRQLQKRHINMYDIRGNLLIKG